MKTEIRPLQLLDQEEEGKILIVAAENEGRTSCFLIDTGANISFAAMKSHENPDASLRIKGVGTDLFPEYADLSKVNFDVHQLDSFRVFRQDFSKIFQTVGQFYGEEIHGFLGSDLMSRLNARFFTCDNILVLNDKDYLLDRVVYPGTKHKHINGSLFHYIITLDMNGHELKLIVDTGASISILDYAYATAFYPNEKHEWKVAVNEFTGLGANSAPGPPRFFPELRWGSLSLADHYFPSIDPEFLHRQFAKAGFPLPDFIIGNDILGTFVHEINYKNKTIELLIPD